MQEKDDANFKLMSERIKANSVQKLLLEEKELLHGQLVAINTEKQRLVREGEREERVKREGRREGDMYTYIYMYMLCSIILACTCLHIQCM